MNERSFIVKWPPKLRGKVLFYVPVTCVPGCLQRLVGKLPDRHNHAERYQTIDGHFQDVPGFVFRLHQQFVSAFPFHVSPFFSERF